MGIERLGTSLARHRRVAVDTSVFIYQLEGDARYAGLTDRIFLWMEQSGNSAVTSTITMTELLVHPYREADEQRVNALYALLSTYPNLSWIPPDLEIAVLAARMCAVYRLRTPDALQAATALHAKATALVTDDSIFERVPGFDAIVLNRLT